MVDRLKRYKNHERWPRDWENICRDGDEAQLRRYIQSHKFNGLSPCQKINIIKCVVISVPCVRTAEDLLRTALFGKTAECRLRPDALDSNGSTLAHFAAQRENPAPLFRCLKDLGTPLARANKVGMSTLHFLFFKTGPRQMRNLREAASYLCKQPRCNIDLRDNEGETPLLVACLRKDPMSALCVLREIGADMKMKTRNNQTALHLVASSCSPHELEQTTKFLIQNNVDPTHSDDDGKTMMHYIAERNDITDRKKEAIRYLINPFSENVFSPRTSSGFSEKMSVDDCEMPPESPNMNCDRRCNQYYQPSQSSSQYYRENPPPQQSTPLLPPPSAFDDAAARPGVIPSKHISVDSPKFMHHPGNTMSRYYPHDEEPNQPLHHSPPPLLRRHLDVDEAKSKLHPITITSKETQTAECNCSRLLEQDNELEILRLRLQDMEMEKRTLEEKYKDCAERLDRYESCQICMESFTINNRTTLKSCGHMMCSDCAFKWLSTDPDNSPSNSPEYARITSDTHEHVALCPVCRAPYDQNDLVKSLIS